MDSGQKYQYFVPSKFLRQSGKKAGPYCGANTPMPVPLLLIDRVEDVHHV
jgi:hypothetical protein